MSDIGVAARSINSAARRIPATEPVDLFTGVAETADEDVGLPLRHSHRDS